MTLDGCSPRWPSTVLLSQAGASAGGDRVLLALEDGEFLEFRGEPMLGYLPHWAEYSVIVLAARSYVAWDVTDELSAFSKSMKGFTVTCMCSRSLK